MRKTILNCFSISSVLNTHLNTEVFADNQVYVIIST